MSVAPAAITMTPKGLNVPDQPIIPFIEGDGTGPDIWRSSVRVFDAAVNIAYGGKKKITWHEVLAGEKAFNKTGNWLPDETLADFTKYLVGIKGPLTTPIGGGIRSLNVALRQMLDLYVCLRPVKYFKGVPSPVKKPEDVDMTIFRENTEDIYAGIEYAAGSAEAQKCLDFLAQNFPKEFNKVRFGTTEKSQAWQKQLEAIGMPKRDVGGVEVGIGFKPVSYLGTERLVHSAISYAIKNKRKSVTIVHKGNIMKFTEGAFREWSYQIATKFFRNDVITERESWILGNKEANANISVEENAKQIDPGYDMMTPAQKKTVTDEVEAALKLWNTHGPAADGKSKWKSKVMIKDTIADITLQQVLTRAKDFDVIATMNLNGDYLSDALAAQVGGIGIAPGANINYVTGHAIFEATHGTAPKYANLDQVNPGSVILSGEMMLRYMGWTEAADLIINGLQGAINAKTVTYDFHRMMDGATKLKCSEFGDAIIKHMKSAAGAGKPAMAMALGARLLRIFSLFTAISVLGGCSFDRADRTVCFAGFLTANGELANEAAHEVTRYHELRIDTSGESQRWKSLELVLCDGTRLPLEHASQKWFEDRFADYANVSRVDSDTWSQVERRHTHDGSTVYGLFGSYFRFIFIDGCLSGINLLVPLGTHCPEWRLIDRATGYELDWPLREGELSRLFGPPVVIKQTEAYFHGW